MSIVVRADEVFGFIELPVRLVDSSGVPVDNVLALSLNGGGCIDFYFADGSEESLHFVDAIGPPPFFRPTWRPVGFGPPTQPVGFYHIAVPRRIFTAARRGPF